MVTEGIFVIRQFRAQDQQAAKRLILAGLTEHFGELQDSLNSDVNNIARAYTVAGHLFYIAEANGEIVGTGAMVRESRDTGRIVRLSVQENYRRLGIARAIVTKLLFQAGRLKLTRVNVETNHDWDAAISLYESLGFLVVSKDEESIHFLLERS